MINLSRWISISLLSVGVGTGIAALVPKSSFTIKTNDCVCPSSQMVDGECFKEHTVHKVGSDKIVLNDSDGEFLVITKDHFYSIFNEGRCGK